jgi:hypothetical protein
VDDVQRAIYSVTLGGVEQRAVGHCVHKGESEVQDVSPSIGGSRVFGMRQVGRAIEPLASQSQ